MKTFPALLITFNWLTYCSLIVERHASKQQLFFTAQAEEGTPVRVAPKAKCCKCLQNVFWDEQGFTYQSNNYDHVLHNIDGGPILRKLKHPAPDLHAPVDPAF